MHKHSACPYSSRLARFLHVQGMDHVRIPRDRLSVEDRIDELSRVVLVVLLIATLGYVL